ncbi:importin N-terminal domain-containing protein [Haematococcus lacustris]|uniref:Importin N-terminal domain-containing protein n=1 Tax=Haematococcus lacustris TaxID=44745 RepID=A0A699YJM6_HAELA|nr:importin N-terminal domain-containing protein [Haematococcus lacustris]
MLPQLVPLAIASLEQDDGTFLPDSSDEEEEEGASWGDPDLAVTGQGGNTARLSALDSDDASDEDDDDDAARARHLSVRTGVTDEKAAALHALGLYAKHVPLGFQPYLGAALSLAARAANYFHEDVRCQAYEVLGQLVLSCHSCHPPPAGAPPGTVSGQVAQALEVVCPLLLEGLEDDERGVVAEVLRAWRELLQGLTALPLARWLEKGMQRRSSWLLPETCCP